MVQQSGIHTYLLNAQLHGIASNAINTHHKRIVEQWDIFSQKHAPIRNSSDIGLRIIVSPRPGSLNLCIVVGGIAVGAAIYLLRFPELGDILLHHTLDTLLKIRTVAHHKENL